jgi:coenzyme PQQ biosynthesis protein PqqD
LTQPAEAGQPRLAAGCRWSSGREGSDREQPVLLYPEGMIRVDGTGRKILELCDGQNSLQQIIASLARQYQNTDQEKVTEDVTIFLETLHRKRIVDY